MHAACPFHLSIQCTCLVETPEFQISKSYILVITEMGWWLQAQPTSQGTKYYYYYYYYYYYN
jgi:hypothetical protein